MSIKGRCLCGQVEVSVDQPLTSFDTLMCHCTSCKRRSGGLASYAFIIPEGAKHITITGSSHVNKEDPDTTSGKPMQRSMCSECGSPIRIIEGGSPETWCLQYGLFAEEAELPEPKLELFRSKACKWEREIGETILEAQ